MSRLRIFDSMLRLPLQWPVWWHRSGQRILTLWPWLWCQGSGIVEGRAGGRAPWPWLSGLQARATRWVIHSLWTHPCRLVRWRQQLRFSFFRSIEQVGLWFQTSLAIFNQILFLIINISYFLYQKIDHSPIISWDNKLNTLIYFSSSCPRIQLAGQLGEWTSISSLPSIYAPRCSLHLSSPGSSSRLSQTSRHPLSFTSMLEVLLFYCLECLCLLLQGFCWFKGI